MILLSVYSAYGALEGTVKGILGKVCHFSVHVLHSFPNVLGFLLTFEFWKAPPITKYFDDQAFWEVSF